MKKQEKIFEVENLLAKIKEAKAVYLADCRGINAAQTMEIRSKVKKAGGNLQVVKNNLILRALQNAFSKDAGEELKIEGPTLALFAKDDEISPLKTLYVFGKASERLALKFGFLGSQFYSGEDLIKIANLPGQNELRAKLVGLLAQQPQRLVFGLNYNLLKLVTILKRVSEKTN